MSTYIPGVTDYIPHIQPFNPNLNFYQAALERKEAQYKEGYNKVNSIYSSLLNSPMLGSVDNETRDKFFKDIENNINKISGMDLSKDENIDAAYQVFQPLIDDKNIMKNIAWTKNYQNELIRGEGFRNCIDEKKCGGKWWDGGIRALHYQAEDFAKEADNHNAGSSENPRYTPYINMKEKVMKNAKDLGFDIKSTSFSKDGRYIITQKDGAPMYTPLADYFLGAFGNDPAAKDMYTTQAYLDRKDFIRQGTSIYGSEDSAENVYLTDKLNQITRESEKENTKLNSLNNDIQAKRSILKDKINKGPGREYDDPLIKQYLDLGDQSKVLEAAVDHHNQTLSYLDKSALIGADKKAMRWRIDNAVANNLVRKDMLDAARDYSLLNSETKIEADPYGKSLSDHMLKLDEMQQAHKNTIDMSSIHFRDMLDYQVALKNYNKGPKHNQVWSPEVPDQFKNKSVTGDIIDVENELQTKGLDSFGRVNNAEDTYLKTVANHLQSLVDAGGQPAISAANDLKKIFGDDYDQNTKKFKTEDISDSKNYLKNKDKMYAFADNYLKINSNIYPDLNKSLDGYRSEVKLQKELWSTFNDLENNNLKRLKQWAATSSEVPEDKREMFQMYIDDKGKPLTREEFSKKWADSHVPKEERVNTNTLGYQWSPSGTTNASIKDKYNELKQEASNKYDEIVDLKSRLYKSNPSINGTPIIKSWDASAQAGGLAGGKFTQPVITHIDAANDDEGLMDLVRIYDKYKTNGGLSVSYGFNGDKLPDDDPKAKEILDRFVGDIRNGNYKDSDLKRPTADVIFSGVALGDPNKVYLHIIPDSNWAEQTKYKGTSKNKGITSDEKFKEGITIYMNRESLPKEFTNKFDMGPYQIILNNKDITLNDYPETGSITLSKKSGGNIGVSGTINYWDEKSKGYLSVNAAQLFPNTNINADILVNQIKAIQQKQDELNDFEKKNHIQKGPITNTNQL